MQANLDYLNLDILRTIKPQSSTDPFFVVFAIDLHGPKWHRDYFFAFMKAQHYEACDGGTVMPCEEFPDRDRWFMVTFYDGSPDYLVVIKDLLYRTNGDIEAVYSYANDVHLTDEEMGVVYNYLIYVWNKFRPTVRGVK